MINEACIMGDVVPRDGGMLPEYTATLFIGIDDLNNDIASGRVWSFCYLEPVSFHGLGNLLLMLDQMLDEIGAPERWLELRNLQPNKTPNAVPVQRTVCHKPADLWEAHGHVGTAAVRIYMRRNASMQGTLRILSSKRTQVDFRSALELLYLLHDWIKLNRAGLMGHQI